MNQMTMTAKRSGRTKGYSDLIPAILFIVGALVTLCRIKENPPATGAGFEVLAIARNLAQNGSFANPYMAAQTGPTAHSPPLYSFYLAALMGLGGNESVYFFLMLLSLAFAHALHASLLPAVSGLLFGTRLPGIYGAVMFIALPALEVTLVREAAYVAIGLMSFCLLSAKIANSRLSFALKGAALGCASGALILLNPVSLLFCLAWTAYLLLTRRESLGWTRFGAGFALGLVLTCLPWTIRNYRELGGFVFVRSNFGIELYVANNDCAEPSLLKNIRSGCHAATHPNANKAEALAVKRMGELSYNREKQAAALLWIRNNPGRFCSLTAQRVLLFWFPYRDVFNPANGYTVCAITFVSLFGLFKLLRDRRPIGFFILAASLLCSGLYSFIQADMFYRYPILWLSLLCAGSFAATYIHPRWERLSRLEAIMNRTPRGLPHAQSDQPAQRNPYPSDRHSRSLRGV
jgi:hypothetical protein